MYKIVDTHEKVNVETGFANREDAKPTRNKLNTAAKDKAVDGAKPRYVISRGAMHPRGETDGFDHTAPKRWL